MLKDGVNANDDSRKEDVEPARLPGDTSLGDTSRDVALRIEDMSPPDGAAVLQELPPELSAHVSEYLDPKTAAHILAEMDAQLAAVVIADMEPPEAAMVLAEMNPDDRVDILGFVPPDKHQALLDEMTGPEAAETRRLEQYPPDTAGGIMTSEVTALPEDLRVEDAITELRRQSEQLEQMFYVYVTDKRGHLVGVLSMRDLILARPSKQLSQVMQPDVLSVSAMMDQEEVANLFRKYNYLAMPVVDERNRLLGIITVDDVVDVLEEEATEDVQKMFGAGAEERLSSSWQFSFKKRFGWLVVNLATAFLAAGVVASFSETIEALVALAVYMPVVAGMGGNAGAQAMSVAIRGIALGKVDRHVLLHVILREAIVGLLTGICIGFLTALVAMLFNESTMLGLVVGCAIVFNQTLACVTGAAIPFFLQWLGFDPAQSSSIFATTITDVVGFLSLLGLAWLLLM